MAAAPVGILSIPAARRSPWGRLGSVLYTCKRLRRMRRRFKHFLADFSQQTHALNHAKVCFRSEKH